MRKTAPIRHADPSRDATACAAIYAPYVVDSPVSFEWEAPSAEQMAERIARYAATHAWLVAEDADGTVVGFAYAGPRHERAAYRWATEASVYVDAAHHGRGHGRALYTALFELLRRQRLHTVSAAIVLPNAPSVALHEALGFEPVGVFPAIGYKAGAWRDIGWWQLRLAEPLAEPHQPLGPQQLDPHPHRPA